MREPARDKYWGRERDVLHHKRLWEDKNHIFDACNTFENNFCLLLLGKQNIVLDK